MSEFSFVVAFKNGEVGLFATFNPEAFIKSDLMRQVAFIQRAPAPTPKELQNDHPSH